jgi:hypothetical protein
VLLPLQQPYATSSGGKMSSAAARVCYSLQLPYATNRDEQAWRCLTPFTITSILRIIAFVDSVSVGEMTSKEQSHFGQCQR